MDISPINRDVIYRTRSAGPNISQYIGSTRETKNLILLVHTYNFQHNTLHCSALQLMALQRKMKGLNSTNNLHMNKYPASPFTFTFCFAHSAKKNLLCSAKKLFLAFVVIVCRPFWLTPFLASWNMSLWNISAIYRDWLHKYLYEIYRQYIGTGCTRSALARQMNFQRCPALMHAHANCTNDYMQG